MSERDPELEERQIIIIIIFAVIGFKSKLNQNLNENYLYIEGMAAELMEGKLRSKIK